ncbi:uncharacterized protein TNCV_154671 [Trichonephila clavipes]|uniref:Uncharacterized protein n=1 Tax=Trichonephila clavipes TaxID=2585209 RepID=A0A8X7BLR4_TRICX|nr:uncharacterized protein TNCV_154671 [Trichonephila clavipes]
MEFEFARLYVGVNSDKERKGEGCNSLDALMKSVRTPTVKVPNRPEATRGLLAKGLVILNHGQVTAPELAPPLLTTTPHQREDVSALDRFNVHRCPTRRVFSGTGLELVTRQATIRYLYHSATVATWILPNR